MFQCFNVAMTMFQCCNDHISMTMLYAKHGRRSHPHDVRLHLSVDRDLRAELPNLLLQQNPVDVGVIEKFLLEPV
jgi:hypothetical protein